MNGLVAAFQGHVGRDAELRWLQNGTALVSTSLVVTDDKRKEDQPAQWVKVTMFGEAAEDLAPRLTKGVEAYCEGKIKLNTWTAQDGTPRSGLECVAWKLEPLGQIGRRRPAPAAAGRPERSLLVSRVARDEL